VRDSAGDPIPGALVRISFLPGLCLCQSSVLTAETDASGQAVITLRGGGCIHNVPGAAVVVADGDTIRSYANVKSPDWAPSCDLRVNLSDLVRQACLGDPCHDYDNDGIICLADEVIFASGYNPSHVCP
jgi:hypothetical protein